MQTSHTTGQVVWEVEIRTRKEIKCLLSLELNNPE